LASPLASANENGVIFTEQNGKISWCNDGLQKISGFSGEEIMGKTPVDLFKGPPHCKGRSQSHAGKIR
jgi:PAS domain S-box-containing protein